MGVSLGVTEFVIDAFDCVALRVKLSSLLTVPRERLPERERVIESESIVLERSSVNVRELDCDSEYVVLNELENENVLSNVTLPLEWDSVEDGRLTERSSESDCDMLYVKLIEEDAVFDFESSMVRDAPDRDKDADLE